MLGLKRTGQLGRRAGLDLLPLMTLVLVACGSVNEQGPNGSGGPGAAGSSTTGGAGSVTPPAAASQVGVVTLKMGGASIDRVVADQVGSKTKLKSLELSGEEGFSDGSCDSGYRCAVGNHIAFDASGTPLPKLFDTEKPHFGQLFLSIANAYGSPITTFGENGMAPLGGLTA